MFVAVTLGHESDGGMNESERIIGSWDEGKSQTRPRKNGCSSPRVDGAEGVIVTRRKDVKCGYGTVLHERTLAGALLSLVLAGFPAQLGSFDVFLHRQKQKLTMAEKAYSAVAETKRILDFVLGTVQIPAEAEKITKNVQLTATRDLPYFPIPFKETELASALKAIEGGVAGALAATKFGPNTELKVTVSLEKSTAFLIQAYLATVGGYGKLDKEVKKMLKGELTITVLTTRRIK